jgi:hypothetical protein
VIAGVLASSIVESKTMTQSARSASLSTHAGMLTLPISSSPSITTRTLTGRSPSFFISHAT